MALTDGKIWGSQSVGQEPGQDMQGQGYGMEQGMGQGMEQGVLSEEDWVMAETVFGIVQANRTRFDPRAKAGFLLTPSLIMRNREQPPGPVDVISKVELQVLAASAIRENLAVLQDLLPNALLSVTCQTIIGSAFFFHGIRYIRGRGFKFGALANGACLLYCVNWGYMSFFKHEGWREQLRQQGSIFYEQGRPKP
jgi:hypothetical protein